MTWSRQSGEGTWSAPTRAVADAATHKQVPMNPRRIKVDTRCCDAAFKCIVGSDVAVQRPLMPDPVASNHRNPAPIVRSMDY